MNRNFRNLCVSMSALLALSACSGDDNGTTPAKSDVSIRFSDAPIGELSEVVITVDKLIFNREGTDIVVDTFTSEELGIENSDTFQIDLLDVQGLDNKLVLDSVMLPVGDYQNLRIQVLDNDINKTYAMETGGAVKSLKVPSSELKLGQFTVSADSSQTFVVEFALNQAMTYNPGSKDRYILKPRGIRVVRLVDAAHISGSVNWASLNVSEGCSEGIDPSAYVAYLYAGHGLNTNLLGDVFVREDESEEEFQELDGDVPANIIAPITSAPIDEQGQYLFSYLQPGSYSLAISCQAELDDPVNYNQIVIPAPVNQLIEVNLEAETHLECNFPVNDSCLAIN